MSGLRKAAILLMGIGEPVSGNLIRQLDPDEIRLISGEIAPLGTSRFTRSTATCPPRNRLVSASDVMAGGADCALAQALEPDTPQPDALSSGTKVERVLLYAGFDIWRFGRAGYGAAGQCDFRVPHLVRDLRPRAG